MSHPTSFLPADPAIERRVSEIGGKLFDLMEAHEAPGIFSKKGAYARLMEWSMKDPAFKTQLFRFVDVLPALDSASEIVRHLKEYLGDKSVQLSPALKAGLAASSFAPSLVAAPVKAQIVDMAGQFVAGESAADLLKHLKKSRRHGMSATIDLLGEAVVTEEEADAFLQRNLDVLETLSAYFADNPEACFSDQGTTGVTPMINLSVKISALSPDVNPLDLEASLKALKRRLRPILHAAKKARALVNFDMESYKLKDLTIQLFKSIFEESEFSDGPAYGIALQAYLRDCEADLRDILAWARRRQRPLSVRLVKGAYWDSETIIAQQRDWPVPVWQRKPESDANYEKLTTILLDNIDIVTPNFASHNVRSVSHAIAQAERRRITPQAYEFQALYGMADDLKQALLKAGYRVREYCAIGEMLPGMAYLVRRLLENTSNEGFLRNKHAGAATRLQLLANPNEILGTLPALRPFRQADAFVNSAGTDFVLAPSRAKQQEALDEYQKKNLGRKWPCIINGRPVSDRPFVPSVNPARPSQVVGYWAKGSVQDAEAAVTASVAFFPQWRATPVEERADMLLRAADIMEGRRLEINSLLILEAGKPWAEADGDTSEAVDFLRFYAREMVKLARPVVTQAVPGEHCVQLWTPRGVGVAVAPWNFPLAILTGLTVAPLVAGNCMIIKPARQTSIIGACLMEILIEAGVPAGALHFLPCSGADAGAHLVAHPKVDFIAFTGSRSVGCGIWKSAGETIPGQMNLKKVVCEMGGKNAMVIDSDADLDEAIPAVLYSAFGYAGQKCSALSRLIVLESVYDKFMERLLGACSSVPVGDPARPGIVVNPVIDEAAKASILEYIEVGKRECTLAWQAKLAPDLVAGGGYYVPPTVFTGCTPRSRIVREEIFGPVLSVLKARDLDEAFAFVNDSDYALTAGFFSRSPANLERARNEMLVGNLYLNRGCTGAIVERHPFGGFKMSGGGTKAGGSQYLENFLFPRLIAENVMRRGFAPTEGELASG